MFASSEPHFANAQPVAYSHARPVVNPITDSNEEMLDRSLLTKSDHWSYEQEWRLLQYSQGAGPYKVPPGALVGVILGSQISEQNAVLVRQWAAKSPSQPVVYRASLSPTAFEIHVRDET